MCSCTHVLQLASCTLVWHAVAAFRTDLSIHHVLNGCTRFFLQQSHIRHLTTATQVRHDSRHPYDEACALFTIVFTATSIATPHVCKGHASMKHRQRHRGDSNPCRQSPMDFKSISLTARTQCLAANMHVCLSIFARHSLEWNHHEQFISRLRGNSRRIGNVITIMIRYGRASTIAIFGKQLRNTNFRSAQHSSSNKNVARNTHNRGRGRNRIRIARQIRMIRQQITRMRRRKRRIDRRDNNGTDIKLYCEEEEEEDEG